MPLERNAMAWRAAQDLADGMIVNLGLGLPVLIADFLPPGREVFFHAENGVVGAGPLAGADRADPDLVDAASRRITLSEGATITDSVAAFGMIRGGHIDVAVLGAFEVAENGDLANWDRPGGDKGPLVGGAMDLAAGARAVRVVMEHTTRDRSPRLVSRCTLPLTAIACVKRIYTDLAVIDVTAQGFLVREIVPGMTREQLANLTGAALAFAPDCRPLIVPPPQA